MYLATNPIGNDMTMSPHYASPDRDVPNSVRRAVEVFSANEARVAVLLWLADHPESTQAEIAAAVGVKAQTARNHLLDLKKLGVITTSTAPDGFVGRTAIRYTLDRRELALSAASLQTHFQP